MIVFILLLLAGLGLLGFFILGSTGRSQAKAEQNAEQLLDEAFDGRSDVVFKVNMASLKYETVVLGAKKRGYKLVHTETNQYGPHTLMFEKTTQAT